MKICAAQIKPFKGDINRNIGIHKRFIYLAVSNDADIIFFPELSLTSYEPKLAEKLAADQNDKRLNDFQNISDEKNVTICVGLPTVSNSGVRISMIIFQPSKNRQIYSKQYLHPDELPFFVNGNNQIFLTINNKIIAPAICYESLLPEHSENAFKGGAEIYFASVAKSATGTAKASKHFPEIAKKYSMPVIMANSIGPFNDFISVGRSSIWNKKGKLLAQLNEINEGILIFDTSTEEILEWTE